MATLLEIRPKWMEYIRDGLLRNFDCNVILVDWYTGSLPPYVQAAGNTRLVGVMIAELIKFLISKAQSSVELFHVVGFSLGSHIAGYCGTRLKKEGLILERITGEFGIEYACSNRLLKARTTFLSSFF